MSKDWLEEGGWIRTLLKKKSLQSFFLVPNDFLQSKGLLALVGGDVRQLKKNILLFATFTQFPIFQLLLMGETDIWHFTLLKSINFISLVLGVIWVENLSYF